VEVRDASLPDVVVDAPLPSRGPTPSQTGVKFPFPQNRENSRCIYPSFYRNEDVQAAYDQWKTDTVASDGANGFRRVKRPNDQGLEANSTVSEGIGYGMLLAVYMNDQTLFDDLWQYEQQHLGQYGLMDWNIKADGSGPADGGVGPATDADEDMAFALLMADKQWGGQGKLAKNYIDIAKDTITNVWNNEIFDYKYLKPWPTADSSTINLSYFAPAYYKAFKAAGDTNAWDSVVTALYSAIGTIAGSNGLITAWCGNSCKVAASNGASTDTDYQYDSHRIPMRLGIDYCFNGTADAKAYTTKTTAFFANAGSSGLGYILDMYTPSGGAVSGTAPNSASILGTSAVGAMASGNQTYLNDAYQAVFDAITRGNMAPVDAAGKTPYSYYNATVGMLTALIMTGNFMH